MYTRHVQNEFRISPSAGLCMLACREKWESSLALRAGQQVGPPGIQLSRLCHRNGGPCPPASYRIVCTGFCVSSHKVIFALLLGLKEDFQMKIFKILAAILHLGNVNIVAVGEERSSVEVRNNKEVCLLVLTCTEPLSD